MKVAHFHIQDGNNNKFTLICNLRNGSISYVYYGGWLSSGMPFSLSNMQCELPVEPMADETQEQFVDRIEKVINRESVVRVIKRVSTNVEFATPKSK